MDVRIKPISVGTLSEQVLAQGTKPLAPAPIDGFAQTCGEGIYPRSAAQQSHIHAARLFPGDRRGALRTPSGINPLATGDSVLLVKQR
ncbi:hypothetical protein [Pseudomonas sp. PB103]|uniref:hypothetical protein n=1 Tax=Pseudomonas sp. PB103 TaxID=2494698 RepID=UPI00131AF10C|nr:hypothetical protein [Pseudomonas sp. PB103]